MAEDIIRENVEEREKLMPVAGAIFGLYIALLVLGYFIGNAIYQIP